MSLTMFAQIFIGVLGLIFAAYGAACFINPALLESMAGILSTNSTASTEIRAMYGGVQIGIGMFYCFTAVLKHHLKTTVLLHTVLFSAVVLTRSLGIFLDGGSWSPFGPEAYNAAALWLFEIPVFIIGLRLVIQMEKAHSH